MSAAILVIKLGAFGDFVQAMGPFAAIRQRHPGDRIVLLTTRPYAELARASPWFDAVWIDDRPRLWQVRRWLDLRLRLRRARFSFVYDLQTSDRSGTYFRLLGPGPRPGWSGIVRGASHRHANPERDRMHTIDRQREQLALAGIAEVPPPDLSWLDADLARLALPSRTALLVPGGAAHRPAKRWPVQRYGEVARALVARGVAPLILGTAGEAELAVAIRNAAPRAIDLTGRTGFAEIAALARRAEVAIGNDTGPMHLIAAAGCAAVVLFGPESDPALCAPRGRAVAVIARPDLAALEAETVLAAIG